MDANPTPGYRTGSATKDWLRIEAAVTGVVPGPRLHLAYTVTNRGPAPVLLADVWPSGWSDGRFGIDPLGSMVSFAPGPVVVVERGAPSRGDDVAVESPWCPLARRLAVGAWLRGTIALPLPARPHDPYHPVTTVAPGPGTTVPTVRLRLGWLPDDGQSRELLPEVATAEGPLVRVKVAPGALVRSSTDLAFDVPALLPVIARPWTCRACGATNVGGQDACLRCGQPAAAATAAPAAAAAAASTAAPTSAPVSASGAQRASQAPPQPAWRATHVVPAGGATWYSTTDRQPGGTLDPGLPVALVEQVGDWGRIVAENGWSGWIDARVLRAR